MRYELLQNWVFLAPKIAPKPKMAGPPLSRERWSPEGIIPSGIPDVRASAACTCVVWESGSVHLKSLRSARLRKALQLHQQWRLPQPPPDVPSGQGEASDGWPRDQPRFVLAPTPAQLGRAPGQLNPRKSSAESSRTADLSDESSRAPPAPQAREDPPPEAPDLREEAGSCGPPSAREVRKSILKRTVDDGMDRVLEEVNFNAQFAKLPEFKPEESPSGATSLPSSPFVQTYRKRPKATGLEVEECEASSPGGRMPKGSPVGTPRTPKTGSKLEGTTFFGPSFSLDALVD
ncbi:unnamed protein product, partial [Ixodes pacificus]